MTAVGRRPGTAPAPFLALIPAFHGSACLTALAAIFLLAAQNDASAQQAYGDGPLVLRPPPGVIVNAPVAGRTVTAGGNVVVNLNAIGGTARAYGGSGYAAPAPAYVGSAPGNFYNRPPLPGEVPLVDEDPIVLRPPGPDGYPSTRTASRPVLRPPIETRPLPPQTATAQKPVAKPTQTAAPKPTAQPTAQPAPVKTVAAAEPAPKAASESRDQASAAARTGTAGSGSGPALRSTVRSQGQGTATMAAATPPAATSAPSTATSATNGASTGATTGATTAAPQPQAPAPKPAQPQAAPQATASASGSGSGSVTLPATSAPTREAMKVPEPPSSAQASAVPAPADTAPAKSMAADTTAANTTTAAATAPARTMPAVPASDAETVTIGFAAGDAVLDKSGEDKLAALASGMKSSDDRLQIKAYANAPDSGSSSSARRLSLSRALSVRSYLIDQGIRSTRIDVRALGDTGSGTLDRVDVSVTGRS